MGERYAQCRTLALEQGKEVDSRMLTWTTNIDVDQDMILLDDSGVPLARGEDKC